MIFIVRVVDKNQQGSVDNPFLVTADSRIEALGKITQFLVGLPDRYQPQNVVRIEIERAEWLKDAEKTFNVKAAAVHWPSGDA
jgi:hypothetical protein